MVLSLKLAEGELIREKTGENPVYLLDDVMSELDEIRRNFILEKIDGRQVLITCCDEHAINLSHENNFLVENGTFTSNR